MTYSKMSEVFFTIILATIAATVVTRESSYSPCEDRAFSAKGHGVQGQLIFLCNCDHAPHSDNELQNCPTAYYCFEHCVEDSAVNVTCENKSVYEGYTVSCRCSPGFKDVPSFQCLDENECDFNLCGENSLCVNSIGSYTCACNDGYYQQETGLDEPACTDTNECEENSTICGDYSVCSNTDGSHTCSCFDGYTLDTGSGVGCVLASSRPYTSTDSVTGGGIQSHASRPYTSADTGGGIQSNSTGHTDLSELPVALGAGIGGLLLIVVVTLVVLFVIRRKNRQKAEARGKRVSKGNTGSIAKARSNKESNTDSELELGTLRVVGEDNSDRHDFLTDSETLVPDSNIRSSINVTTGNVALAYEEVDIPEKTCTSQNACMHLHISKPQSKTDEYHYLYANRNIPHNKAKQSDQSTLTAPGSMTDQFMYDSLSKPTLEPTAAEITQAENYSTLYDIRPTSSNEYVNSIQPGLNGSGSADYDVTYRSTSQQVDNYEQPHLTVVDPTRMHNDEYDELKLEKV